MWPVADAKRRKQTPKRHTHFFLLNVVGVHVKTHPNPSMWKQSCLKQKQPGRWSIWWLLWQLKWKFSSQSEVVTNGQVNVGHNLPANYNTDNSESMTGWSSLRFSKYFHRDAPDVHKQFLHALLKGGKLESGRGGQCPVHYPFSSHSGSILTLLGTRLILTLTPLHARYGCILL